jgi:hypothetical protein
MASSSLERHDMDHDDLGHERTLRSVFWRMRRWRTPSGTAQPRGTAGWIALTTASTGQLNGVWGSGQRVVVGDLGWSRANGTSVVRETVPFGDDLNAVAGFPGGIVTVVSDTGGVLNYGTTWTLVSSNGIGDGILQHRRPQYGRRTDVHRWLRTASISSTPAC